MMTNTKIVWRLKELPTSQALRELVKDKILSSEEARQILFSSETIEENKDKRDVESLKSEIKFLRELVEKLSNSQSVRIIETIREIEKPWKIEKWYKPYDIYCMDTKAIDTTGGGKYGYTTAVDGNTVNFSDIKTF